MTAKGLYRIVYLSRAAAVFDEAEAGRLAEEASEKNRACGVTGLLLYDGERFIQALEGGGAEVVATMDRIAADTRHGSIVYLQDGPADDRQFGTWAMQYKRAPQGCCSTDFLDRVKDDVTLVEDPNLRAAFIGFAVLGSHHPRGYVCGRS